jgi:hypothetical protein
MTLQNNHQSTDSKFRVETDVLAHHCGHRVQFIDERNIFFDEWSNETKSATVKKLTQFQY